MDKEDQREKDEAGPRERQEWFYKQRAFPMKKTPVGARAKAHQQVLEMQKKEAAARNMFGAVPLPNTAIPTWQLNGPKPTNTPYFYGQTSGRVTAIAIDPTDTTGNTAFLGGADGGVWKTTNGGSNWTPLTDDQFSLAIGSIAVDPNNHNNVYVGTGEENFSGDAYYGGGLLKSTDGGTTWAQIGQSAFGGPLVASIGGSYIGSIAIQPGASGTPVILVATQYASPANSFGSGIYRSTDGGSTWNRVLPTSIHSGAYGTSVFYAADGSVYAAIGDLFGHASNGVYKSTDNGATWNPANGSGGTALPTGLNVGRITIVGAPSNASVLYASIQDPVSFGLLNMYKSTDGGGSWNTIATPLGGAGGTGDFCGNQCWYDMPLGVSPANASVLYAGGSFNYGAGNGGIYMTTNGGTSWSDVNPFPPANVGIHPDFHQIVFSTGPTPKLYIGDDGGAWSTTNIGTTSVTWTNLNATLAITQFYPGLSVSPTNPNLAYNGTQDNGTQKYTGSQTWSNVTCGDGAWTAIDPSNNNIVYSGCTPANALVLRSTDGGNNFSSIGNGISGSGVAFIPPLVMDPTTPTTLYYGTDVLNRTKNATAGSPAWTAISPSLSSSGTGLLTSIAVAPQNSSYIMMGYDDGTVVFTTDGGATWLSVANFPRYVTMVQADPNTLGIFYITLSGFSGFGDTAGHVFGVQVDPTGLLGGADLSGDLPNIPVNDIVLDPDTNWVYVATDDGVFYTSDFNTWNTFSTGLPNVAVVGLKLQRSGRTLFAATHGRSMWSLSVPAASPATIISPSPRSVLSGSSATFTWTQGSNVAAYLLYVGTALHTHDVFVGSSYPGHTSMSVTGIPTGGATLYVTLYSAINGVWVAQDYTYTEAGATAPATITSPVAGSTVGASATLNWTAGSGVTKYLLYVGTTPHSHDVLDQTYGAGTTSAVVSGIPATGANLYATLYSLINGAWSAGQQVTYVMSGTTSPAVVTSPAPGSTLTGSSATFSWTTGSGPTQYLLYVGTAPHTHDISVQNLPAGTTSANVTGIPTTGGTLYVTLYSLINGTWSAPQMVTYTEF